MERLYSPDKRSYPPSLEVPVSFATRGSAVSITLDRYPGIRSMMGGTLDDKTKIEPRFSVWVLSRTTMAQNARRDCLLRGLPGRYVWRLVQGFV